jgi:hypothetical protein
LQSSTSINGSLKINNKTYLGVIQKLQYKNVNDFNELCVSYINSSQNLKDELEYNNINCFIAFVYMLK